MLPTLSHGCPHPCKHARAPLTPKNEISGEPGAHRNPTTSSLSHLFFEHFGRLDRPRTVGGMRTPSTSLMTGPAASNARKRKMSGGAPSMLTWGSNSSPSPSTSLQRQRRVRWPQKTGRCSRTREIDVHGLDPLHRPSRPRQSIPSSPLKNKIAHNFFLSRLDFLVPPTMDVFAAGVHHIVERSVDHCHRRGLTVATWAPSTIILRPLRHSQNPH